MQRVSSYQCILNKLSTCFLFLSVIVVFNVGKLKITIYLNLTGTQLTLKKYNPRFQNFISLT